MIERVKVYIKNNFAYDGLNVYVLGYGPKGEKFIGERIKFVDMPDNVATDTSVPTMTLKRDEGQALMDILWQVGFRPTEGMGSAGSLSAMQDHLKTLKDVNSKLFRLLETPPTTVFTELKESSS